MCCHTVNGVTPHFPNTPFKKKPCLHLITSAGQVTVNLVQNLCCRLSDPVPPPQSAPPSQPPSLPRAPPPPRLSIFDVQDAFCSNDRYRCSPNATFRPPHCRGDADCPVQLLRRTPAISKGQCEQIATNLRLNIRMPFLGDTFDGHVWNAFAEHEPVLFHAWTPTSSIMGIPFSRFTRVQLPPRVLPNCTHNLTASLDGDMQCDFPWQILMKVGRKDLRDNSQLEYFAHRFDIRQVDHAFFFFFFE